MVAIIALNIVFAVVVVGSIVGLLAHSILTSRTGTPLQPERARTRRQTARRLTPVTG